MKYLKLVITDAKGNIEEKSVPLDGWSERDARLAASINIELQEKEYGKGNVKAFIEDV